MRRVPLKEGSWWEADGGGGRLKEKGRTKRELRRDEEWEKTLKKESESEEKLAQGQNKNKEMKGM